jgi:hypothetical protein
MAADLKVTGCTIDTRIGQSATTMGDPYVFMGGAVDLDPMESQVHVITVDVTLDIHTSDGRVHHATMELGRKYEPGDIITALKSLEQYEQLEAGLADAFAAWLREQGLDA